MGGASSCNSHPMPQSRLRARGQRAARSISASSVWKVPASLRCQSRRVASTVEDVGSPSPDRLQSRQELPFARIVPPAAAGFGCTGRGWAATTPGVRTDPGSAGRGVRSVHSCPCSRPLHCWTSFVFRTCAGHSRSAKNRYSSPCSSFLAR